MVDSTVCKITLFICATKMKILLNTCKIRSEKHAGNMCIQSDHHLLPSHFWVVSMHSELGRRV